MSKHSKRKKREERKRNVERALKHELAKLSSSSPVTGSENDGQFPSNHTADDNPNARENTRGFPLRQWIIGLLVWGGNALVNYLSSDPRILYFCWLTISIWLFWFFWRRGQIWRWVYAPLAVVLLGITAHIFVTHRVAHQASAATGNASAAQLEKLRRSLEAGSKFMDQAEVSELLHRFPIGCQVFTMTQTPNGPHAVLTDSKTILPPDTAGKMGYLDFNWMQQGHASIGDDAVFLVLPAIALENTILAFFANEIVLKKEVGVSLSLDVNPKASQGTQFLRGSSINSVAPGTRWPMSSDPTLSVVIEVRAITDNGAVMVLGLKPYDGSKPNY